MAIFSLQKSGVKFTVNTLPFLKKVLQKVGPDADFHKVHEQIQDGEIPMEPGDYLSSVNLGNLKRGANIGIADVEAVILAYLGTMDAHLSFNELRLPKLADADRDLDSIVAPEIVEIAAPGASSYLSLNNEPKLIFSTGEKHILDKNLDRNFSIYGYSPDEEGGGRLAITHVRGFDEVISFQMPTHFINEEDNPSAAILDIKVKLPPKPDKKIKKFYCAVSEGKPGLINIGEKGLYVPYGDSTFVEMLRYPNSNNGLPDKYIIMPRVIDGLIIDPDARKFGTELIITSAKSVKKMEEKRIFTHVYNKIDGSLVPINLFVKLLP